MWRRWLPTHSAYRAGQRLRTSASGPRRNPINEEALYYDATTPMSEAVQTMLQTNAEAARETEREADPGFLWDFWYPVVRSTEITGRKLATAMLLEVRSEEHTSELQSRG